MSGGVSVFVEVSVGELIDKISILRIKAERLRDTDKLANVILELEALERARLESLANVTGLLELERALKHINELIWDYENEIRVLLGIGEFGDGYLQATSAVHQANEERARIKRNINELAGSRLVEEKAYGGQA